MEFVPQAGTSVCHKKCVLHVLLGIQGGFAADLGWRLDSGTDRGSEEDDHIADVIDRPCVPDSFVYLCLV